ncbi:MAG: cyclic nucleotide-binding domain-containing protein [Deltaproteobacteria bacterium]|nr:cyclic nucleotide-binding domain-containing protein [Deltaproteobacteria bacterium]
MVEIDFTDSEIELLHEVLVGHIADLRMEIACTDRREFREFLYRRRDFMEDFIRRLEKELEAGGREMIGIDRLKKVDILQGLTEWELQSIAPFFREENFAADATLCVEGEKAQRLYILEQGAVSIRSKRWETYEIDAPGKIVGWSFLVPPNLYTATGVTLVPSRLLVIENPDFYYFIHKEQKIGMKVMENLTQVVATRLKGPGK